MTLRRRLARSVALIALAVVVLSTVAAWWAARAMMLDSVDDALRVQAELVQDAATTSGGIVLRARDGSDRLMILPEAPARQGGPAEYAQTLAADGSVVTTRGNLTLPVTRADLRAIAAGTVTDPHVVRIHGTRLRMMTVPLTGAAADRFDAVAVQLARPLSGVDQALRQLWIALAAIGALAVLLAVVIARALARRILRPVAELDAAAAHIASTAELDAQIPVDSDDELGALTERFNLMLDRLQAYRGDLQRSIDDQRNLVADASHELRTPVTSLRMNAELLLEEHDALSAEDRDAMLVAVRDQSDVLANLVTDLIELARGDAPDERADETIDLDGLVRECVEHAERDHRGVTFRVDLASASVRGRPDRLARAVTNLLNNAALHGTEGGGAVDVALTVDGDVASVRIADHGPGVSADERERIFDRFRRGDDARGRTGSGLGLAIVRQVAAAHRGTVTVDETPGGGATFVLRLPVVCGERLDADQVAAADEWNASGEGRMWDSVSGDGLDDD